MTSSWIHIQYLPLHWRHNELDGVSNHQPNDGLLNHLFRRRSKKTSKLRVTGLSAWNSPVTGEFPAQRVSNTENVSIWWRHHEKYALCPCSIVFCYGFELADFTYTFTLYFTRTGTMKGPRKIGANKVQKEDIKINLTKIKVQISWDILCVNDGCKLSNFMAAQANVKQLSHNVEDLLIP